MQSISQSLKLFKVYFIWIELKLINLFPTTKICIPTKAGVSTVGRIGRRRPNWCRQSSHVRDPFVSCFSVFSFWSPDVWPEPFQTTPSRRHSPMIFTKYFKNNLFVLLIDFVFQSHENFMKGPRLIGESLINCFIELF